jgi:hypothetical protein
VLTPFDVQKAEYDLKKTVNGRNSALKKQKKTKSVF